MKSGDEIDATSPNPRPLGTEEQLRVLVQNVPDYAIFMLDAGGHVTVWNEGAKRVKGYEAAEVIGRHFSIFFTPQDRERGKPEYEKGMAEAHGRYEGEGWRVRKDGTRFWGNEILTAVRDENGRVAAFTKIARDLTTRRAMEEALAASEERCRLLVDNIRDYAVFVLDPEGRIASWNPGAQRVFGYTEPEAVGQDGAILFTPEDRAKNEHGKELATALAAGHASDDRWQMRKGGERFWASGVTSAMRDMGGGLRGFAKVCRDLTDRRQIEVQREQLLVQEKAARLEAEQAMTMRDEFLAVVSHELRTPLTAILLWSRLVEAGSVSGAEQAAAITTIRQSAEAQRQLVEDLLDVSRITSGKLRLHVREADVAVVVRAAVEVARPMADARGVAVELEVDDRVGQVRADPDRIQQVVWNLLNNAVKFTDRGGRVTVRLVRVDGVLRLSVADTGRGIADDFLPHVFDLFRQGESALTRVHGGLGLGLSICKKLVELHGGTIVAQSPGEGRGATFTVELPLADVGGRPPVGGPPVRPGAEGAGTFVPSPVLAGVRVLFAEDEAGTRTVVQWLLEQCGAAVTAAGSAAAAMELYRAAMADGGFDVIVSDIAMPEQDGYELLRQVRAAEAAGGGRGRRAVPALALSARARDVDVERATAAGFQAHVGKPVEPEVLVRAVVGLVRG